MERLPCTHKGTYADDCICERIRQHKCYIVATCDRDLRRRIRKVASHALKLSMVCSRFKPGAGFAGEAFQTLLAVSAEDLHLAAIQVPGVPIMYLASHKFTIERLPEATMGGAPRN